MMIPEFAQSSNGVIAGGQLLEPNKFVRILESYSLSVSTNAFILGECPHTFVMKEKTQFVSSSYRFGHIL